jgi:hypothetical protein
LATALTTRPRLVPVPAVEPPYDSDHSGTWLPRQVRQDPLPLAFDSPGGLPAVPDAALPAPDDPAVGNPERWAARFAQALVETLAGIRSPAQLAAWTTRPVHGLVERRARLAIPGGPRPRLGRVHLCLPTSEVVEAGLAMHAAGRARALAFRLEARDGRWVCTELELG